MPGSNRKISLFRRISDAINSIAKLPPRDRSQPLEQRIQILETTVSILNSSLIQQSGLLRLFETSQKNQAPAHDPKQRCAGNLAALIDRIQAGQFEGMPPAYAQLVMTILPETPHSDLDIFGKNRRDLMLNLQPLYAVGWDEQIYGDRLFIFSKGKKMIDAVTEITLQGIINAAGCGIIGSSMEYFSALSPETTKDTDVIPIMSIEKSIIETVSQYCQVLVGLGVRGILLAAFGTINLRKSVLFIGSGYGSDGRVYEGDKIIAPPVEIPEGADIRNRQVVAKVLRPAFDFIWREYNYPRSLNYGSTGEWGGFPGR